jgi:hypothetical protein
VAAWSCIGSLKQCNIRAKDAGVRAYGRAIVFRIRSLLPTVLSPRVKGKREVLSKIRTGAVTARVLKKYFLYFFKATRQKRGFAKWLESGKRESRFTDSARRPGARSQFSTGCYTARKGEFSCPCGTRFALCRSVA